MPITVHLPVRDWPARRSFVTHRRIVRATQPHWLLLRRRCVTFQDPFPRRGTSVAACLIANRIRGYVPQRQMFPDMALSMSASFGFVFVASRAAADMI